MTQAKGVRQAGRKAFTSISVTLLTIMSLLAIIPFVMIITGSLSSTEEIIKHGYSLFIQKFTLDAYRMIFINPWDILNSYTVSIVVTVVGTFTGLFLMSMAGYAIQCREMKWRNGIAFYFYFTTLFNGGLLSTYIFMVRYLNLKNSLLAVILPLAVNVFYMLILKSFMQGVPFSIIESAKIDGAGEYRIFFQLVLPLTKAGLATVGLFLALDYWNDWYNAMLYLDEHELYPLQYMLYNMMAAKQAIARMAARSGIKVANMPSNSLKMAMAIVAVAPVILLYPFVQKYFVRGITIGAVKG